LNTRKLNPVQIKDVARLRRLRRRRSLRGRVANISDRFSGWFVVSIVGFLTAVAAFMIVRSERWLFDLKEGHCKTGFFKSFSVCCPDLEYDEGAFAATLGRITCPEWETWDQLILPDVTNGDALIESWVVEYMTYTAAAVSSVVLFPQGTT
jgi:chloride channel 3/4/5